LIGPATSRESPTTVEATENSGLRELQRHTARCTGSTAWCAAVSRSYPIRAYALRGADVKRMSTSARNQPQPCDLGRRGLRFESARGFRLMGLQMAMFQSVSAASRL
jgi:hypothetical protein